MIKKNSGFTLIELMIVVAILGVVAAFAYNSYSRSVEKSRRSEAKNALLHAATLQERLQIQNNQYSELIADLGGATTENEYYAMSVATGEMSGSDCDTSASEFSCFIVTATAQNAQASDESCATLTIDSLGRKTAQDSGGTTNDDCW
jgi:type IV pilus assembly protein PilE